MLNKNKFLIPMGIACMAMATAPTATFASDSPPTTEELLQRINALEQQVHSLQKQQQDDQEEVAKNFKNLPVISAGAKGFSFRSADTNFVIQFHGLAQMDTRNFFNDGGTSGNDTFLLRRLRPIISGTVYHDFNYMFMPDFGMGGAKIQDAYLDYHYSPELQLRVGRFKTPLDLEFDQSPANTTFNELALASELVPYRDLGVELHGELLGGRLDYGLSLVNGVPDGSNETGKDSNDGKEVDARLFAQPFKKSSVKLLQGVGFGVGGSYSHNTVLPKGYKTDGGQTFFTYYSGVNGAGDHWRLEPQASYYSGPLGLMGSYVVSSQRVSANSGGTLNEATLNHQAWQVTGSWILTGEDNTPKRVSPANPFNLLEGHWGAWGIAARYSELSLDDATFPTFANASTSANKARAWSVGLSWWLNYNVRLMTSYSHTMFSGGTSGTVTQQPEDVLFTRVQLAF